MDRLATMAIAFLQENKNIAPYTIFAEKQFCELAKKRIDPFSTFASKSRWTPFSNILIAF